MRSILKPLSAAILLYIFASQATADTLKGIYELALQHDAKLKSAEATYRANMEVENQAFSQMLPQIKATASYEDSDGKQQSSQFISGSTPTNFDMDTDDTQEVYQLSLQQNVFNLSTWFNYKSGKASSLQAQAQLAADQQDLMIRTAEAYFTVLRAKDNVEAAKAEERATKRQLEQTQQRFDVGLIAITDVHESRAAYDDVVVRRLTFEGDLGTAYEALTVLTGQAHADLWLLNKDFPVINPAPVSRDEWVQFALKNNYNLKAAQARAEASRQTAKAKKMEHAPKVTASYTYSKSHNEGLKEGTLQGFENQRSPSFADTESTAWGVSLSVPIYSGGSVSSQRRQAYEQYNASRQQEIDTRRTVVQSTRSFHLTVTTDVQRVKARDRGITSTQSALEATQAGYEVGTRNIVDVLQAQRNLYGSFRDYANSRYDYVLNMLRLKQQAGTLSPQDIIDLDKWLVVPNSPKARQYEND